MIHRLIESALKNRTVVIIAAVLLIGICIKFLLDLPVDVYPDLNVPVVNVMTEHHGMAPEDMETLVTFPLESAFNSLPFVRRVRSNSTLGLSKITIEFEYGTNIYFARQLVTDDETDEAIPELIAFWEYLKREYKLPQANSILKYLHKIKTDDFKAMMFDPSKAGMAKSFFMMGQSAGYDMTDEKDINAFMHAYNTNLLTQNQGPSEFYPSLTDPSTRTRKVAAQKKKRRRKVAQASRKRQRRKRKK